MWNNHWFFFSAQHHLWNNFIKRALIMQPVVRFYNASSESVCAWWCELIVYIPNAKGTTKGSWMRDEKKQKWSSGGKERSLLTPPPPHTCKRLISPLHYQASAAGTGFNSSSIYHWATTMVNLDYVLYLLPNHSITSTCLVRQPGNQINPESRPGGFTQNLLSCEEM